VVVGLRIWTADQRPWVWERERQVEEEVQRDSSPVSLVEEGGGGGGGREGSSGLKGRECGAWKARLLVPQ
jgi:hypothetical protein